MPSRAASSEATTNMWPSRLSSALVTSLAVGIGLVGTIRIWVGARGWMSRKAITRSSRWTMAAGSSPLMMRSKRVGIRSPLKARAAWPMSLRYRCDGAQQRDGTAPVKLGLEGLAAQLADRLLPVYLLSGDEPLLVGEAADAVRARAF